MVLASGNQLALMPDKGITVALAGVDLHQLQTQVATLRRRSYSWLQQISGVIQATAGNA
ncbi:hypothetical protein D3C77_421540 [compost metagenome]